MGKPSGSSPQTKINVTSKSPVGDISVVTLIRTDTTLDHSQKAEKVWARVGADQMDLAARRATRRVQPLWRCVCASSVGSEADVTRR